MLYVKTINGKRIKDAEARTYIETLQTDVNALQTMQQEMDADGYIDTPHIADGAVTDEKIDVDFLKSIKNDYVSPEMFGAVENGVIDINKFLVMVNYAITNQKYILFENDYIFDFVDNSTIQNPTRIKIENIDGLRINGNNHEIYMRGCSLAYINSINDNSSSGRDIFTFLAFHNCKNILVENLKIRGDNPEQVQSFRFASPRSIGIGFKGCNNCLVRNVHGKGIFGNVVNATTADDLSTGSSKIIVTDCTAEQCLENGFNFMGESSNSIISNCVARKCQTGFEIFGDTCFIVNCIAEENYICGVALSGGNLLNSVIKKTLGDGADNGTGVGVRITTDYFPSIVRGNRFVENYGFSFHIYGGINKSVIEDNVFIDDTLTHSWGVMWYLVGTEDKPINNAVIRNNVVNNSRENGRVLQAAYTNGLNVSDNVLNTETTLNELYLTSQGNDNFVIKDNKMQKSVLFTKENRKYFVSNIVDFQLVTEQ